MEQLCGFCSQLIFGASFRVICNGPCRKQFHHLCAGLDMTFLNDHTVEDDNSWFCPDCSRDPGEQGSAVQCYIPSDRAVESVPCPQFPVEIWANVFEKLNFVNLQYARLVSSHWKEIVDDFCMSKFVIKIPNKKKRDRKGAVPMLPAATIIYEDACFSSRSLSPSITKNLAHLKVNNYSISLRDLLVFLRNTPNLVSLNLLGSFKPERSTNALLKHEFSDLQLKKMKNLTLKYEQPVKTLEVFSRIFPQLKDFALLSHAHQSHLGVLKMIETLPSLEGILWISSFNHLSQLAEVNHQFKRVSMELQISEGSSNENLISFSEKQPLLECFDLEIKQHIRSENPNNFQLGNMVRRLWYTLLYK